MNQATPQTALQKMLAQPAQAGVYRLPNQPKGEKTVLAKAAKSLGFASFKVSLGMSEEMPAILAAFGRDLKFPAWYGANFDALNDCLTDFSWHEAPGYIIVISGADTLVAAREHFAALNAVFANAIAQWQTDNIPLWVFYEFAGTVNAADNLLPTFQRPE